MISIYTGRMSLEDIDSENVSCNYVTFLAHMSIDY